MCAWPGWKTGLAERWDALSAVVKIAMVGKYTGLSDAYLSVLKALQHACLAANRKLDVQWVEASHLEPAALVRAPVLAPHRPLSCTSSPSLSPVSCPCHHCLSRHMVSSHADGSWVMQATPCRGPGLQLQYPCLMSSQGC